MVHSIIFTRPLPEIVKQRFSCRNYFDRPLAEETRQRLAPCAASTKIGPFGTQSRFELVAATEQDHQALNHLGTYGFIKDAPGFIIGATQDAPRNLEDYGYLMESIILFATDLGLGTCWLGGSFTKSSFAKKISAARSELVPAVTSVGYINENPRGIDGLVRRRVGTVHRRVSTVHHMVGSDRRLSWEQLFFDASFAVPLQRQNAADYLLPLEMVRMSPSASNQQPWRIVKDLNRWHFYLQRTPGYRERILVRLFTVADLQRIDMGIAMCHFELMAEELGLPGGWEINPPVIGQSSILTEYTVSWVG